MASAAIKKRSGPVFRAGGRGADPKLRRTLVTPEGMAMEISIASAGARAGALVIDLVIQFTLMLAVILSFYLILMALGLSDDQLDNAATESFVQFLVVLIIITLFLFRQGYFLYFELGDRAATWGKRLNGIRVASRDGGRLTADAIIARNLLRDIEIFLPIQVIASLGVNGALGPWGAVAGIAWIMIFALFPLFNRDRLRGGDLIAGTWVVQAGRVKLGELVAPAPGMATPVEAQGFVFTDEELAIYGEYELQTLESVLRGKDDAAQVSVAQAICRKIGWEAGAGMEREFLEAYYTQLRARLERNMRFGNRKSSKFDAE